MSNYKWKLVLRARPLNMPKVVAWIMKELDIKPLAHEELSGERSIKTFRELKEYLVENVPASHLRSMDLAPHTYALYKLPSRLESEEECSPYDWQNARETKPYVYALFESVSSIPSPEEMRSAVEKLAEVGKEFGLEVAYARIGTGDDHEEFSTANIKIPIQHTMGELEEY